MSDTMHYEHSVRTRYAAAAQQSEAALCCPVPLEEAQPFDCRRNKSRHPSETKGQDYNVTSEASGDCCGPDGVCC
jgi:hypothetical protein